MTSDVIFLYVSKSGGHARAAEAISKEIHALRPELKTSSFDSSYFHPVLSPIISRIYIELITRTPEIWNYVYDNKKLKDATREIRELFNLINLKKLEKLIESCRPGVIVCTHALPASIISCWKLRTGRKTRTVSVITDYGIHSYWAHRGTDLYLIPDNDLTHTLRAHGVPASKVFASGIPIDSSFLKRYDKKYAQDYFGLAPGTFTVLVMGGNEGIGPYAEIIAGLNGIARRPQMLVSTGKNGSLFRKLEKKFRRNKNVRIFKYIRNVSCAMDAADVLITKPGGLTITEAMTKHLPMIIINPIQGQELRNTEFFLKRRLALNCEDADNLPGAAESLMEDSQRLERFRRRLNQAAKTGAARLCAEKIIGLLPVKNG